jgi:hypothetical protein
LATKATDLLLFFTSASKNGIRQIEPEIMHESTHGSLFSARLIRDLVSVLRHTVNAFSVSSPQNRFSSRIQNQIRCRLFRWFFPRIQHQIRDWLFETQILLLIFFSHSKRDLWLAGLVMKQIRGRVFLQIGE